MANTDRIKETSARRLFITAILVLFLILPGCVPLHLEKPAPTTITILHTNDTHGHILPYVEKSIDKTRPVGNAACLAAMIENERSKNPGGTLLLSGGDMFQGTPISNLFRGKPVIEIMNYLKFDAMTVGNHEFDWRLKVLEYMIDSSQFPFLSSNIITKGGNYLPGVKPYIILERKGLKIAVIGVTTVETAYTTKPDNVKGLTFLEPATILPGLIKEVRNRGADMVIVLSHIGLDADTKLAADVPGIDVIVGGHSHTAVTDPVYRNGTIIVQAGCYDAYLGVLNVRIEGGKIVYYTKRQELKPVFSDPKEPTDGKVTAIVNRYNDRIKAKFSETVGETAVDLVTDKMKETNEGNLICDVMKEESDAVIALLNSGSIRSNIPRGKITMEQLFDVLPFDNFLVIMDLTGSQLDEILEQSATMTHGILQVSGIHVTYDLRKPVGHRVTKAYVRDKPVDPKARYRIVTNDFLAAGGDQYTTFKEGTRVIYGDDLRDVLANYLKEKSPVHPLVEDRTIIIR